MFQSVKVDDLKYNQKYKIVANNVEYSGIYKGIYRRMYYKIYLDFDKVKFLNHEKYTPLHYFLPKNQYYQFVSQHPQQVMEKRAFNLVLRGILGDEHFEW